MQNSYIIDAFLSGVLWLALVLVVVDVRARTKELSQVLNPSTFGAVFYQVLIPASLISAPLIAVLGFLLWRFYALMIGSASFGAGGAGLLVIMGAVGAIAVWLDMLLAMVRHARSADFAQVKRENEARRLLQQSMQTNPQARA